MPYDNNFSSFQSAPITFFWNSAEAAGQVGTGHENAEQVHGWQENRLV